MVFQLTHLSPNYRFKYKVLTIKSVLLPGVTKVVFVLVGHIQHKPRHSVCRKTAVFNNRQYYSRSLRILSNETQKKQQTPWPESAREL
jgi:hypothetical protein